MARFTSSRPFNFTIGDIEFVGVADQEYNCPDDFEGAVRESIRRTSGGVMSIVSYDRSQGGSHPDLAAHVSLGLLTAAEAGEHTHEEADVDGLTAALASKADTHSHPYAATVHAHAQSSVTGLVSALAGKADSSHSHADGDLPAGIARDSELTAAIAAHEASATHGGEGGGVPAGVIAMWGGLVANIPSGWVLCDGNNGTPDLRGLFIKGAVAGSDPGATGGSSTHTHAAHTGIINHTHSVSINDPGHDHVENLNSATNGGLRGATPDTSTNTSTATGYSTAASTTGITASTANPAGGVSSISHDSPNSEPPYYALAFIQKQ